MTAPNKSTKSFIFKILPSFLIDQKWIDMIFTCFKKTDKPTICIVIYKIRSDSNIHITEYSLGANLKPRGHKFDISWPPSPLRSFLSVILIYRCCFLTPHLKWKKLLNNSSWDFEHILDTMDDYWFGPDKDFFPESTPTRWRCYHFSKKWSKSKFDFNHFLEKW